MSTTKRPTAKPVKPVKPVKRTPRSAAKKVSRRPASPDAIAVLKADHRAVEALFDRFEGAGKGALRRKRALVDSIIEALSRHASIEELVFYPAVRREVAEADSTVLEALEEHHFVKVIMRELEDLDPANDRFDAKVNVLMENVRHHVREEERELFPTVRAEVGRRRLLELGEELRAAKPHVPTRPHPSVPDEPSNNVVGGAVAVMDRARAVGRRVVDRVIDEVPAR